MGYYRPKNCQKFQPIRSQNELSINSSNSEWTNQRRACVAFKGVLNHVTGAGKGMLEWTTRNTHCLDGMSLMILLKKRERETSAGFEIATP